MYINKIEQTPDNEHFQCGDCEFLANALHEKYNYEVVYLLSVWNNTHLKTDEELLNLTEEEWDDHEYLMEEYEDLDELELIHAFCKTTINGKDYYIDSTGITDDITDIYKNFRFTKEQAEGYPHVLLTTNNPAQYQDRQWSTWRDMDIDYDTLEVIGPEQRKQWAVDFVKEQGKNLSAKLQVAFHKSQNRSSTKEIEKSEHER